MGFSAVRVHATRSLVLILLLGMVAVPLAGPIEVVEASPLNDVTVEITPSSQDAIVTHDTGDVLSFEGVVTIESISSVSQTTTLSGSTTSGWTVSVNPEQITSSGSGSSNIDVEVTVPKGLADGRTETLTVRASSQISVLSPTVDTDTAEITVKNTSPDPQWDVRITEPAPNEVYTTDGLLITGTASFNLGPVTSVEVKVCTGPWTVATGTDQWSIDYDCSYMDDEEHTIYVRARSGEDHVSPDTTIVVVQDRSGDAPDPDPNPPGEKDEESSRMYIYIIIGAIIIGGVGGAYWVYTRRQNETQAYLTHYY